MSAETLSPLSPAMDELERRWARLRSHKRAVASLRFLVEWQDGNVPRRANGVTVDVSQSGCMAVVGADLPFVGVFELFVRKTVGQRTVKLCGP